jgi:hypothetical protein
MFGPSDISTVARNWKEKFRSIGDKNVDDCYSDFSLDDDPKAPKLAPKDPTFGVDAVLKTFFEGKNSTANHFEWVETPPKQMSKKAARAQDRVAIKVYKVKDMERPVVAGTFALKFHMLEIQSPVLVAALKDIVKKEDVYLEATEVATFKAPFRPLWFCTEQILALQKNTSDGTVLKDHLSLLLRLMGEIFGGMRTHLKHLQSSGLISFKLAWTYFPKDSIIYSPEKDCERLYKVKDTVIKLDRAGKPVLHIKCKEIRFDGESFVWKDETLEVPYFEGNRPITEMKHYPLSFHPDPQDVKKRLIIRGQKVLEYQGLTYCGYSGLGIYNDDVTENEKHNVSHCDVMAKINQKAYYMKVSGRILIDTYGYNKHHLALKRRDGKDQESKTSRVFRQRAEQNIDNLLPPPPPPGMNVRIDPLTGLPMPAAVKTNEKADDYYIKRLSAEDQKKNKDEMLAREEDLIYLSPMLVGYALKNKIWCKWLRNNLRGSQR